MYQAATPEAESERLRMASYTIETVPFIADREERAAYYDDLAFLSEDKEN